MLGFSEATAGSKQMEAATTFERDYDDQQYEEKIAGLVRRSFASDARNGGREAWDGALADLGDADLYLVVMLKKAGVWEYWADRAGFGLDLGWIWAGLAFARGVFA